MTFNPLDPGTWPAPAHIHDHAQPEPGQTQRFEIEPMTSDEAVALHAAGETVLNMGRALGRSNSPQYRNLAGALRKSGKALKAAGFNVDEGLFGEDA